MRWFYVEHDFAAIIESANDDVRAIRAQFCCQGFVHALGFEPEALVDAAGLRPGFIDGAAFTFVAVFAPSIGRLFQFTDFHGVAAVSAITAVVGGGFSGCERHFWL